MKRSKNTALILIAGGLMAATAAGFLTWQELRAGRPLHSLVMLIGLGLAALVLSSIGMHQLVAPPPPQPGPNDPPRRVSYRHMYRLFTVTALALVTAGVAREFAVPDTYGQHGFYRGSAVVEARNVRSPAHQGKETCARCHKRHVQLLDKDAHARLQCESCHGVGREHVAQPSAKMKIPRGQQPCLACHLRLDARPSAFAQIEVAAHYQLVGVKHQSTACTTCHNPHEPLYMDRDLRTARLHPLVHRCRDCHSGAAREERSPRPPRHPAIFECRYCHGQVVADFATRPHKNVRCATCHVFFKESDFAGRILRDADPRFCLLCHKGGDFRAEKAPPSIDWPQHREDMGGSADKRCIDCHREKIHRPREEAKK